MDVSILYECTLQSIAGMMNFPESIKKLSEAGVEAYYADLIRHQNVYYFENGESHVINYSLNTPVVAENFNKETVHQSVVLTQENQISYREFLNRVMAAGCRGYFVFLKGEKVIYLGRKGDIVTEEFPNPQGESFGSVYNTLDI
ncbi:hypothetical protein D3C87_123120 [compost metagenome]